MKRVFRPPAVKCPACGASHVPSIDKDSSQNGVLAGRCVHCGHFFKFRSVAPFKSTIDITVNGKKYTVGNEYSPGTALNGWLRDQRISVGTKHMCYQGGCGTCLVEAKLYEPISEQKLSYALNSCLIPLYACDGMEIQTVDYIGNLKKGLHPIQQQIANYNGSQCGYCTPGQVMNMFALKEFYGDNLTQKQVEDSFDGVICRCTGFRPILAAFKDMAKPSSKCKGSIEDIEDFKGKICQKTGSACTGSCSGTQPGLSTHIVFAGNQWYRPTTEEEITTILNQSKGKSVHFMFGNTASGVYSDLGPDGYDVIIDLASFKEMYSISFDTDVIFGAGITLTNLIDICTRMKSESAFFGEMASLMSRVANLPVRNRATWAGNLVMKHIHKDFPSDIFVMMNVLKAKVWTGFMGDSIDITDFLNTDITSKLVLAFSFTMLDDDETIKFYKVQPRAQNAHSYVTGGFRVKMDQSTFMLKSAPVICYGGMGASFNRASKTEAYLNGKILLNPTVLQTALSTLKSEVVADSSPVLSSAKYREDLAVALFYKFVLHIAGTHAGPKFRTGSTQLILERPISSGQQSYDTKKIEYPVTEPLKKLEANAQATGEAEYVDDMPAYPNQLEAAFVLSTEGNATIDNIDPSGALAIPGVVSVITAKDIPGINNWAFSFFMPEEVLASDKVSYCGQPVAIVLAETYGGALGAAYAVKVTYKDVQKPLLDLQEAIDQKSFFDKPCDDVVVGDPDTAISQSPKQISGKIGMGEQFHFHMETQASLCIPKEDGMDVYTTTQWLDYSQTAISQVTGMPKSSINVQVKRLGGAYGAKITRNSWVAAACGLAAHLSNRPVKFRLTLGDNMKIMGKRFPYIADYQVGFTEVGQLNGIKVTYYGECGISPNDGSFGAIGTWADNAYNCPNWKLECVAVKTNKATNTACRSPGSLPAIFIIESIMEHVAKSINKDPTVIREMNMYTQGDTDPLTKMKLENCLLKPQIATLQADTDFVNRQQDIAAYNQANRWKKKGISLVPMKFGISWSGVHYGCQVSIYWNDGTVAISHGGVELGQGVNTKVAQCCAYEFGIPMEKIKVLPTNSLVTANGITTGGSITSENCCAAVIECCKTLNDRMAPVRAKMKDPKWLDVINKCYNEGIDLSTRFWTNPDQTSAYRYYSYGATITEVEFDVLTGEHEIVRSDILFDCGQSTNPALDVGQVEGAFVMGLGYWLTEECKYDPDTGALVTDSTWEYKPPTSKDIPVDFRVNFYKQNPNPAGILGAKACGEPPMCMSCSALFAVKRAIEAARRDVNIFKDEFFPLDGPATVEKNQQLCLNDISQYVLT